MRKLLWLLLLATASAQVTVVGTISDPTSGGLATSGYIQFDLTPSSSSVQYYVSGGVVLAPQTARCGINASGQVKNLALTGACAVWGVDVITPSNLTYCVSFAPGGTVANRVCQELIAGTTYNLNAPVFGPVVSLVPQYATYTTNGSNNNITPSVPHVFNVGTSGTPYAAGYFDNLFVNGAPFNATFYAKLDGSNQPFIGAIVAPAFQAKGDPVYDITAYGALGNDVHDDTSAIIATEIAALTGGVIYAPCGTYLYTLTILPPSNTITQGAGGCTVFNFVPTAPFVSGVNDRAFHVTSTLSARRQMAAGAIAVGATTFVANSASDTADLVQGDWILITETDAGAGDIVIIDWVQVKSVSTVTVTVQSPFRKAFPNARAYSTTSGLAFIRVTALKENVSFRDFKILQPNVGAVNPSLSLQAARNMHVDNVIIDNPNGQSFYTYKAQGVYITNSVSLGSQLIAPEFAATVDLHLKGGSFGEIGTINNSYGQAATSALTLNLGTAFFSVVDVGMTNGANIMMQLTDGVSDGAISLNNLSWVRTTGAVGNGIVSRGSQRVTVNSNTLAGGTGAATGIDFGPTTGLTVDIPSAGNVIWNNSISNFTNRFGTQATTDVYFNPDTSGPKTDITGTLNVNADQVGAIFRQTSSTSFTGLRLQNDLNASTRSLEIDYSGSAYPSNLIVGSPVGEIGVVTTTGAFPLVLGTTNTARAIIDAVGNVSIIKGLRTGTASKTDLAGTCTLGTDCVITFTQTYTSAPSCVATDTTAAAAVKVVVSTTTATFTGTGTDVLNYVCIGRN